MEAAAVEKQRRKKQELGRIVQNSPIQRLIWNRFRVTDHWARVILSNPATGARSVRGEKGGEEAAARGSGGGRDARAGRRRREGPK